MYEGSSGPAIGGLNNAESLQAAETLKKLIEESEEVADYQYEGYYQDLDLKISMGIKMAYLTIAKNLVRKFPIFSN